MKVYYPYGIGQGYLTNKPLNANKLDLSSVEVGTITILPKQKTTLQGVFPVPNTYVGRKGKMLIFLMEKERNLLGTKYYYRCIHLINQNTIFQKIGEGFGTSFYFKKEINEFKN